MKKDFTDITFVLDRSGSMSTVRADTIGGFNAFLESQRRLPGEANMSLFQFDTVYEPVYEGKPVATAPDLTMETFVPRGRTALLDAIGRTIVATGTRFSAMAERDRSGKVIFVIITDGEENSSHEFTREKINEMITLQRDIYKWQFVFIGANQDAIKAGSRIGVMAASSLSAAGNSEGTRSSYQSLSRSAGSYRTGQVAAMLFSDDDRKAQVKAGA